MLALQINNQWTVLSEDQSITIEENSPVWGEGNTFSLPFELNVEANRHILGNSDQLTGMSVYDVLEGQPATLYIEGIPLFYGKLSLEDEVEIEDGTIEVSLISSRLAFDEMIDGMNCQDVELKDEIIIGERVRLIEETLYNGVLSDEIIAKGEMYAPESFMWMEDNNKSTVNTMDPYPQKPYCNISVCYQMPDEEENNPVKIKFNGNEYVGSNDRLLEIYDKDTTGEYVVLRANRSLSSPCFFVLYFLECLFNKLGFSYSDEKIRTMEDMCRLAFVSTSCAYDEMDMVSQNSISTLMSRKGFDISYPSELSSSLNYIINSNLQWKRCIANSKNFPNTDVSSVIKGLQNGFGIRLLFDNKMNHVTMVFIKDILTDPDIVSINVSDVYNVYKAEEHIRGFRLTYGQSGDDTRFNYNDWGNPIIADSYNQIVGSVSAYNNTLYVHNKTGNAYRVKVNEEASSEDELNPSLFEVGGFGDAIYGDVSKEDFVEKIEIGFTPVVMNDVYTKKTYRVGRKSILTDGASENTQMFSLFLDIQMKRPRWIPRTIWTFINPRTSREYNCMFTYFEDQRFDEKIAVAKRYSDRPDERGENFQRPRFLQYENISPIQSFSPGFMLGVMRGGGNNAGVEDFDEDYDGEGNAKYVTVSTNPSFHSDTVDDYARAFDYNGSVSGGVDNSGRFSLKLRAEKPIGENGELQKLAPPYAKRGLFDKFYTEYAYFVTHRKIAKLTLRMEIADLVNIDWTKRYRIGDFIGFINYYSYTVNSQGISEVKMELYYI